MTGKRARRKGGLAIAFAAGCLFAASLAQDAAPPADTPAAWGDPGEWSDALDIREKDRPDVCDPSRTQVHLTVANIRTDEGMITAELYRDDQDGFLNKKGRLRRVRAPAAVGSVKVCIDAEPGTYAAAAYHDRNGDRDLDKKWNMMPKEPFGLSNNPEPKFGWPKIAPSLFVIGEPGGVVSITLVEAD